MLSAFANTFKIPELRSRILYTLGLIFAVRIVAIVPVPGVNTEVLRALVDRVSGGLMAQIDMFSGGALSNFAVGALGIMPYISASIIIQLMTAVIPALEKLAREGDRQTLTQYTRYLTLVLCVVQALAAAAAIENPRAWTREPIGVLVPQPGLPFRLMTILTMTTGTMIIMWLGEQITARGIGNGISLIITINIVSRIPFAVRAGYEWYRYSGNGFMLATLGVLLILVIMGTIALTQAQRKIPIQYAKRVVGRKVYGGQSTYMPLRINYSGVMPIIFAQAILMFPAALFRRFGPTMAFGEALSRHDSFLYILIFGLMILFFSYFWVSTQFNPLRIADDLKRYGGYVPGYRPGRPTAEFLDFTMTRITFAGAVFLTVIAVIPTLITRHFGLDYTVSSLFGGTSLLIVVGVMLDTMRQVETHLLMRHYDGFLTKGRLHSRR